jgi:hypothetical protein
MIAAAHRLFPQIPAVRADSSSLPFSSHSFDVVSLRHVLEHLPAWLMEATLVEAMRVARRVLVLTFYVKPFRAGSPKSRRVGENFLETRWTRDAIESPIAAAGWTLRERFKVRGESEEGDEFWIFEPAAAAVEPNSGPKVSIVMATYRRAHSLFHTIDTLRAQTHPNWELILVDNAGDGGYEFGDARIRVLCRMARASAAYARNEGIRHATGDLLCFFDDDDDMLPEYLERFVQAFAANPGAKMVRCGMYVGPALTNFSYATPECCLRREFATPTWTNEASHDQLYFARIAKSNGWSENNGAIVAIREPLCRANANPRGGLRSGGL